jgi:hypothetical protein
MNNTTPEGFRTASYLEAKARLDARKTTRNVQCNPPNVRCGNRCIPPSWDCRLKGQGTDPHLRAVKTDPLGGLANIQRGFGRITRGVVKGNFSEVEGGKRAIIRGAVKVTPGNIQQKKELQKKLEERTRAIGIGLAVVTGGLGIHAILMKSNTFGYREGVGANINNSVRLGMSRVLDATPIIGANRARVRAQVQSGIEAQLQRQANPVESVLTGQLARTTPAKADTDARSKLVAALQVVNNDNRGAKSSFDDWNKEHQRAFFTTTKHESGVGLGPREEGNVFARPATDEFLTRQFNLQGDDTLTSKSIKDAVQRQLTDYKSSLLDLAQQQGFSVTNTRNGRVIAEKDQRGFIQGVVNSTLPKGQGSPSVRSALTKHLEDTLTLSPKGRTDALYRDTYKGFDEFYKSQGSVITNVTQSTRMTKALRATGAEETMLNGTMARSQYLLGLTRPGQRVQGPAHAELVLRDYHAEVTGTGPRRMYTVTDRLAIAAASELEGRTVNKGEAFQILEREGFTRAVPTRTASTARTRPVTEGEAVYALMRENPGMTLQAARREIKRRRGDEDDFSPELVRTATYLAARADFKEGGRLGKPCGASHIPKAHECRKGQGAPTPESDQKRKAATIAAVAGGVVAIAVAGSVAYNLKTLSDPTKSPLTPSPGIKDLVKSMKQEAGTKSASEAMGYYYTKKSGLKPGDVVYFRNEKDPAAHFGIYLGEGKDGKVRAVIANTNKSRFSWTDVAEIGATKPGLKTSQALMTPLVKAPDPKFKATTGTPFTNEEVVKRAIRIAGTDYKFSLTKDNCEALANGIAYGVPESEQLQRFRRATRAVVDVGVSRGQRREGREAIYQGRAQGRSYTATEFVTFLQGQREFSSPAGKDLAKQYAQYFEGSRLDAQRAGSGLISPEELWSRIKSYGPAMRAQAMADYLLIQRSFVEMARGRR